MDYKKNEAVHYDHVAEKKSKSDKKYIFDIALIHAHNFYFKLVEKALFDKQNGIILDYGCGSGEKHISFCNNNWKLIGIDISSKSIEHANYLKKTLNKNAEFYVKDCENTEFDPNSFDIILDYGTLSSLDLKNATNELLKIIKPNGVFIAIETLGHNPIFNLKRKINVIRGSRTKWAEMHIMKMSNWNYVCEKFKYSKVYFFGLLTGIFAPLLKIIPGKFHTFIIKIIYYIDKLLFKIKILRKHAFKTVVILSNPIKK